MNRSELSEVMWPLTDLDRLQNVYNNTDAEHYVSKAAHYKLGKFIVDKITEPREAGKRTTRSKAKQFAFSECYYNEAERLCYNTTDPKDADKNIHCKQVAGNCVPKESRGPTWKPPGVESPDRSLLTEEDRRRRFEQKLTRKREEDDDFSEFLHSRSDNFLVRDTLPAPKTKKIAPGRTLKAVVSRGTKKQLQEKRKNLQKAIFDAYTTDKPSFHTFEHKTPASFTYDNPYTAADFATKREPSLFLEERRREREPVDYSEFLKEGDSHLSLSLSDRFSRLNAHKMEEATHKTPRAVVFRGTKKQLQQEEEQRQKSRFSDADKLFPFFYPDTTPENFTFSNPYPREAIERKKSSLSAKPRKGSRLDVVHAETNRIIQEMNEQSRKAQQSLQESIVHSRHATPVIRVTNLVKDATKAVMARDSVGKKLSPPSQRVMKLLEEAEAKLRPTKR